MPRDAVKYIKHWRKIAALRQHATEQLEKHQVQSKGRLARILDRWDDFTFYVLTKWWLGVQFKRQRKRMGLEPYFDTVQFDHVDGEDIFPEFSQSFQELPAIEWDKYIHERGPGIRGEWI